MPTPSTFECFGLIIHGWGWEDVRRRIADASAKHERLWIVTANPEIVLSAKRDASYWTVLRQADLRLVDGFGLSLVGRAKGTQPVRLAGVELAERLLALANDGHWKIALIGGAEGIAERAARVMHQRFPDLTFIVEPGGLISADGTGDDANEEALHRLTLSAPDFLFVAFGHPKQERWIARHLDGLPSVKVAVGIGGTLEYWAGTAKRAPAWMRRIGLEWLWRLCREPKRWRRIWNAVVVFPIRVLVDR